MKLEEWIEKLKKDGDLLSVAKQIPLGENASGETVFSQTREKTFTVRHTCVTGENRTAYILSLLKTLSCLYEKTQASFLIVSPKFDYSALFSRDMDITIPFVAKKADLNAIRTCVCELLELQTRERGCPRLVLVLDGLEELETCNENGELQEYRDFFELLARRESVDIITGVELRRSIFSGYPGAFVGVGNALVTTKEVGQADVTVVGDDSSLSLPISITYPKI